MIKRDPRRKSPVFVAWSFMRRAESMRPVFEYRHVVMDYQLPRRWLRPAEYVLKCLATVGLILRDRPSEIWVQLAPTPLLYAGALGSRLLGGRPLIADCHNSMLELPWIEHPFAKRILASCAAIIVHNEQVRAQAVAIGLPADRICVIEERPALQIGWGGGSVDVGGAPTIVLPASFNADEPIGEVVDAARMLPDVSFVITGDFRRARGRHDLSDVPANVRLTGYLQKDAFDEVLRSADVLLGLTDRPDVQLSSAGEGIGAGCPMVLSDTPTLRDLYATGTVFIRENKAGAIATGVATALAERSRLRTELRKLADERMRRWSAQAESLQSLLASHGS